MPYPLCTVNFMTNSRVLAKSLMTTELRAKFNVFDFITIKNRSKMSGMMCSVYITRTIQHYHHTIQCMHYTLHSPCNACSEWSWWQQQQQPPAPRLTPHLTIQPCSNSSSNNDNKITTQYRTHCRRMPAGRKYW